MNKDQIEGNWTQFKGKVQKTWGKLTDDDVAQLKGNTKQFFGRLQELHGINKEEAENQLKELEKSCGNCYTNKSAA